MRWVSISPHLLGRRPDGGPRPPFPQAYGTGGACPSTHPVPLPNIKLQIQYHTSGGRNVVFAPREDPSDAHADFWNTWDQDALEALVRDCINAGVNCGARGTGKG